MIPLHDEIIIISFFTFIGLEFLFPRSNYKVFNNERAEDIIWNIFTRIIDAIVFSAKIKLLVISASFLRKLGMSFLDISNNHLIVQLGTGFLTYSFFVYWTHRILHTNKYLWEFHKIHHSISELNTLSSVRSHFVSVLILDFFPLLALNVIRISDFPMEIIFFTTSILNYLNHSNLNIKMKIFSFLFVTPEVHMWHHAKKCIHNKGQNFGIYLTIWDRAFKTFYVGQQIPELGLEKRIPNGVLNKLVSPFKEVYSQVKNSNK